MNDGTPEDGFKQRMLCARAAKAELELANAQGKLIDAEGFVAEKLDPFSDAIRQCAELLERLYPEAADELRRVLDEARTKLR